MCVCVWCVWYVCLCLCQLMCAYFSHVCVYAFVLSILDMCVQLMFHGPTAVDAFKINHYL